MSFDAPRSVTSSSGLTANEKFSDSFRRSTSVAPSADAGVSTPPPVTAPPFFRRSAGSARHKAASTASAAVPLYPGSASLNSMCAHTLGVDAFAPLPTT
eukprot:31206-Pelagococcus_subviridis.AAC.8